MNIKDVEGLAALAKLELSTEEKEALSHDLEDILGYVKQIESVQAADADVESKLYNVWREDEVKSIEFSPELIKSQFPDSKDGFLKVKKIL